MKRVVSKMALLLVPVTTIGASVATVDPVEATRISVRDAKARAAKQARAPLNPRATYLRGPDIGEVRLSPDGRYISFHRRRDGAVDVILQNVASGAQSRVVAGINNAETAWSGDGRRLWISDAQGLAVVDARDLEAKRIVKWNLRSKQRLWAVDARAPQYAIVHERVAQSGRERHRYLRADAQGKTRLLVEAALPLRNLLLDAKGNVAYVAGFDGPRYETVILDYTSAKPRELMRCNSIEECRLVGYNESQRTVWVLSNHNGDKFSLRRRQAKTNRWETVHRDPAGIADADALLWSAAREDWLAVAYHGGRRQWYGNSSDIRSAVAAIQQKLPDANLQLSVANDGGVWLVRSQQANRALDRHYIYRSAQNRLEPLFEREEAAVKGPPPGAAMHPVTYRARDGMMLHGYVLLPPGIDVAKAPIVAWLHGGPITRMYDRYDASMQLLANRGYVVFVPNFRASTGYGLSYVLAAKGDVGNGRVLTDAIDGLDFLLAQRIGDSNRQAVMGMSFGGYTSLLALSHYPSRFRFAFAGAPPTEYGWIKQWQAEHDSEALRAEGPPLSLQFPLLGFPYKDAAWRRKMNRESPLAALGRLEAPVYIWAGARDDRVPLKSIAHYSGEARRLGKPVSLLIDPAAGHAPGNAMSAEALLYFLESAANRHLGGPLSPPSTELSAFMRKNLRMD